MIQDIYFNGRYLTEYGCVITEPPKRPAPVRRYEKVKVPGRNGDLLLDDECYDNISIVYKVATIPTLYENRDVDEVLTALRAWLLDSVSYRKLYDTELPDGFYHAFCAGISDAVPTFEDMYEFEITFDCKPFFYLDSGQKQITAGNSITLYNDGNMPAYPKIQIVGSGSVQCYINGQHFTVSEVSPNTIIDSEKKIAYSSLLVDKSDVFSGNYPVFKTGSNAIQFVGNQFGTAIIQPRWCRL